MSNDRGVVALPDIAEIVGIEDPVARNRRITRAYRDLARAVAGVVGRRDANWLTFGAWASDTAGRFIRGEGAPVRWGAGAVAEGNRAIIADIGPRFARFVTLAATSPRDLPDRTASDPMLTANDELAEAFACYAAVAVDPDTDATADARRASLMLRANVLVAHHEQRMADPWVDRAIPLGGLAGILGTRFVSIRTPDGDLDVCRDVPHPRYLGGAKWPDVLARLEDPRLRRLFDAFGQADDGSDSDAPTWEDLNERMGFIACFFRAYQRDPDMFDLMPDGSG